MAATQAPARPAADARRARLEAVLVSVALAGNNAASYVLNVVAARLLVPALFGELSSLLALLVIGVVPAMGLQTAVALRVAAGDEDRRSLVGLGLATSACVTAAGLVAVPLLVPLLHLGSPWPVLWLALSLGPLTLLGLFHGLLQGTRRFGLLAGLVALEGLGKVGGTMTGLLAGHASAVALAGTALGSLVVAFVGWVVCKRPRPSRFARVAAGDVVHATQAMLALVLLVNLDLVLARHTLPARDAGEYAVGAVITKIAYWLPQAVGVLVLPRLVHADGRRRAVPVALGVCAAIDGVFVLGAAVFGGHVIGLVGGADYAGSTMPVWPFALAGSMLSLVQILLYARIASADRRSSALVWLAVLAEVVLVVGWLHGSTTQVVTGALVTVTGLAIGGGVVEWCERKSYAPLHLRR